ncbi:hypothetical protein TNCV_4860751 [Trichonephila clavipes]|nr:hypothetical protein TNCV_4860751 [Trichonephila clavipes]
MSSYNGQESIPAKKTVNPTSWNENSGKKTSAVSSKIQESDNVTRDLLESEPEWASRSGMQGSFGFVCLEIVLKIIRDTLLKTYDKWRDVSSLSEVTLKAVVRQPLPQQIDREKFV